MPINEDKSSSQNATLAGGCPLSALLSQTLVAFTLEVDYEFERRMKDAGFSGTILSRLVWQKIVRFVGRQGIRVHELSEKSSASDMVIFMLGCLERWHVIELGSNSSAQALWQASLRRKIKILDRVLHRPEWQATQAFNQNNGTKPSP